MYYTDSILGKPFQTCVRDGATSLFQNIPPGSDTPPAHMPRMETNDDYYDENNYGNDYNKDLDQQNDQNEIHRIEDKLKTDIQEHIDEIDAKSGGRTSSSEDTHDSEPSEMPPTKTKEKTEGDQSGSRGELEIGGTPTTTPPYQKEVLTRLTTRPQYHNEQGSM